MNGQHSHGNGNGAATIVALGAVAIVAIVAPVVLAVVHAILTILILLIVGILSLIGVAGGIAAALIWRHGWPTRDAMNARAIAHMIGGDTHGNRTYRAIDSVAYRRGQEEARPDRKGIPQAARHVGEREQEARSRVQARSSEHDKGWQGTRHRQ